MKLCKDCKHASAKFLDWLFLDGYRFAKCRRQDLSSINLVTGNIDYRDTYCSVERENFGDLDTCGTDAKYFEAKK